ncbi:MAG: right-handed parallel beta-helix repeat-containing protein [Verrucomicrobiales bacterium]|jgi:autotransporter family porin|nr:right-handed parallel beta-helix repeat-containing protein [Verrucomicrobiales bacterium]
MNTKLKSILLLSALSVSALNVSVFADNKVVTEDTTESNQSYNDSDPTLPALRVTTEGVTYNGTNITLSATNDSASGAIYGRGAYVNNASLSLTGGFISTFGRIGTGVFLAASSGALNDVNIKTEGVNGNGVIASANSTLLLTGGSISTSNTGGYGVNLSGTSSATLNNVNIKTEGQTGRAVYVTDNATLLLSGGTINTTGPDGHGIYFELRNSGTVDNVTIKTTGSNGNGVYITGTSTLKLTDSDITATSSNAYAISVATSSTATVSLNNNTITGNIYARNAGSLTLSGSNGTVLTSNVTGSNGATIGITLSDANTELHGNFLQIDAATAINLTVGADALFHGSGELDSLTLASGAIIGYADDVLLVTDSITIGDGIIIDFSSLTETGNYQVLDWSGATITGGTISEDQFTATNLDESLQGSFSVAGSQLTFNATAVPEPSTWFLIGAGLGALALIRRRSS